MEINTEELKPDSVEIDDKHEERIYTTETLVNVIDV